MFAAGGQSPWWMAGISGYMTMFSSGTFMVWGGIAFRCGLAGVSILMMLGVAALAVGWLLAPRWKATGVATPAEYVERRFGRPAVQFLAWFAMAVRMVGVAVALYAISVILSALVTLPPSHPLADPRHSCLAVHWAVLVCGGIVVVYTIAGACGRC